MTTGDDCKLIMIFLSWFVFCPTTTTTAFTTTTTTIPQPAKNRVIIVANRLPVSVSRDEKTGEYSFRVSSGTTTTTTTITSMTPAPQRY